MINIKNIKDDNFRYKMNSIEIIHTSNNCFTILTNLQIISKQLNHNPKTILKFISLNLGCKDNFEKMALTGIFEIDKIQKIIYQFIDLFVLCQKCSIPELKYSNNSKKKLSIIETNCLGCGFTDSIISNQLSKNNKKILDKIIIDINNNYFTYNYNLSEDEFI